MCAHTPIYIVLHDCAINERGVRRAGTAGAAAARGDGCGEGSGGARAAAAKPRATAARAAAELGGSRLAETM